MSIALFLRNLKSGKVNKQTDKITVFRFKEILRCDPRENDLFPTKDSCQNAKI